MATWRLHEPKKNTPLSVEQRGFHMCDLAHAPQRPFIGPEFGPESRQSTSRLILLRRNLLLDHGIGDGRDLRLGH